MPDRMRASGHMLAERLAAPVRLSFMGLPGAGKTTLIQALLGLDIPGFRPEEAALAPSLALSYGPVLRGKVTFEDETREEVPGPELTDTMQSGAIYAEISVPCERLRDLHIFELVTDGSPEEMCQAAPWASERCDIAIWCSRQFGETEADIWAQVPDGQKDHAILALTQADLLSPEQMTAWLDTAHDVANTGFSIIAPVAARRALEAQMADQKDAEWIAQACGVEALWQEILCRVDQGRQMDLAHADLFLKRFERARHRRETDLMDPPYWDKTGPLESRAHNDVRRFLRQQSFEILTDIEEFGPFAQTRIMARCLDAANQVMDIIADDVPATAQQALAHGAASDAADMLLLMTLENTTSAAEDAVHLILQVQREFELAA
ncbi:MAG: hypothetical protein AAF280_04050 [Pseudomonadota bacterium]